jgi:GntR family transcriptional regulator
VREIDLEEALAERITSGDLKPGCRLPSERDLGREYDAGRGVVKEAVGALIRRGLLRRDDHKDLFVARPKVEHDLRSAAGFSEQMGAAGLEASARLLNAMVLVAPPRVAAALRLEPGARVAKVERVRYASRMPMTLEEAWLPDALYPDVTGLGLTESLYALMRDCYARGPVRASERLEAVPARAPEAKLLHIPVGAPLMLVERIAYDEEGTPIEYAKDRHRGDRASFVVESIPRLPAGSAGDGLAVLDKRARRL